LTFSQKQKKPKELKKSQTCNTARVADLAFLKPDFKILAFFERLWLFLEIKKSQTKSVFFQ